MIPPSPTIGHNTTIGKKRRGKRPLKLQIITERQSERLREIQKNNPTKLALFKKVFEGKTKAGGIRAKCFDCSGFKRKEVALCQVETCPLWPYRPFRKTNQNE